MELKLFTDWINALRSKKYKQGKGYLKKDDKYCCLGILCDICPGIDFIGGNVIEKDGVRNSRFIPDAIEEEIGLHWTSAALLSDKNDAGTSFDDIADWLDKNKKHIVS